MNIFYLDEDVIACARAHMDKHVVKMPIEYAQLLSTAHHCLNTPQAKLAYRLTHKNHPSAVWTRSSWLAYDLSLIHI